MKNLGLSALSFFLTALAAQAAHTQARLILAADTANPGDTVLAGIHLTMDAHWHTYWKNSGASGAPTEIAWQLPAGVTAGEILWPVPEKLPDPEFTTYIYNDDVVLLTRLKLAPDLRPRPLELKAKVSWLECEQICVKGSDEVKAALTIGMQSKPSVDERLLGAWEKRLPQNGDGLSAQAWWETAGPGSPLPSGGKGTKGEGSDLRSLIIEWSSPKAAGEADFFPYSYEKFEVQGDTERVP